MNDTTLNATAKDELIRYLIKNRRLANAKNISDWYLSEEGGLLDTGILIRNAFSAWFLSDYVYAVSQFRKLLAYSKEDIPQQDIETMEKHICQFTQMKAPLEIDCKNERLHRHLIRLSYVFSSVNKPVRVFVADNEQDYDSFYTSHFSSSVYPYKSFEAVGLYDDPNVYWLVFKNQIITGMDDEMLLGECAHEMAHIDIESKNSIKKPFQTVGDYQTFDQMINEKLTDL